MTLMIMMMMVIKLMKIVIGNYITFLFLCQNP